MRIADTDVHLTYCLNVHPGESWAENLQAIRDDACRVRDSICPGRRFGLGLRLGYQAARELEDPAKLAELREFLEREDLYVFTVNAFPYGNFHASPVKENVYRPDWTELSRVTYTATVAEILADLLPDGIRGSISTVPVSYKGFSLSPQEVQLACENLIRTAEILAGIEERTGKTLLLALEPEPDCLIENTDELLAFYGGPLLEAAGRRAGCEQLVRKHLGLCFDTAHAAVEFEDFVSALDSIHAAGIPIAKIQISSALAATGTPESLEALQPFCEPVYLHQTKIRHANGDLAHFADLPEALGKVAPAPGDEWRVHYHVPLFWQGDDRLGSTSGQIRPAIRHVLEAGLTDHLEIETYTFTVLPPALAPATLSDGIAEEFRWLLNQLAD